MKFLNIRSVKFLTLLQVFLVQYTFQNFCGTDQTEIDTIPMKSLRVLEDKQYESIRIFYDYTTMDNQTEISQVFRNSIKQVLNNAKNVIESLVMVKRNSNKFKLQNCTYSTAASEELQKNGVDADLVIFPYINTTNNDTTEGKSSICYINKIGKPIGGIISFTFNNIKFDKENWYYYYTNLCLHELTHVLVFNPVLFSSFRDENNEIIPYEKVIKTKIINYENVYILITPKVVEAARKHFNCPSLEGVPLENQGSNGTIGKHWESRVMLQDLMIGVTYDDRSISEITLALFEDSGWYKVNYYTGGLFRFGKNAGCEFIDTPCIFNNRSSNVDFFCNKMLKPLCFPSRNGKGICGIHKFNSDIAKKYQYFPENNLYGGFKYADYCPIAEPRANKTRFFAGSCSNGVESPNGNDEVFSEKSGCFMSSLINNNYYNYNNTTFLSNNTITNMTKSKIPTKSICYEYECDYNNNLLYVIIGNKKAECPNNGGFVQIEGYYGKLLCPYFDLICTSKTRCNNMIDCALKKAEVYTNSLHYTEIEYTNYYFENDETENIFDPHQSTSKNNQTFPSYSMYRNSNINFSIIFAPPEESCGYFTIYSFIYLVILIIILI